MTQFVWSGLKALARFLSTFGVSICVLLMIVSMVSAYLAARQPARSPRRIRLVWAAYRLPRGWAWLYWILAALLFVFLVRAGFALFQVRLEPTIFLLAALPGLFINLSPYKKIDISPHFLKYNGRIYRLSAIESCPLGSHWQLHHGGRILLSLPRARMPSWLPDRMGPLATCIIHPGHQA